MDEVTAREVSTGQAPDPPSGEGSPAAGRAAASEESRGPGRVPPVPGGEEAYVRLPGRSPVPPIRPKRRKARRAGCQARPPRPELSIRQILGWADLHYQRTHTWPAGEAGGVTAPPWETWRAVDRALPRGLRGLPGASSLARLLADVRGVPNRRNLPHLTEAQILGWALAHRARTGRWPTGDSGPVEAATGETWTGIEMAPSKGRRGLPGGTSLSRLVRRLGEQAERGSL